MFLWETFPSVLIEDMLHHVKTYKVVWCAACIAESVSLLLLTLRECYQMRYHWWSALESYDAAPKESLESLAVADPVHLLGLWWHTCMNTVHFFLLRWFCDWICDYCFLFIYLMIITEYYGGISNCWHAHNMNMCDSRSSIAASGSHNCKNCKIDLSLIACTFF
jgi:hypothetical protein